MKTARCTFSRLEEKKNYATTGTNLVPVIYCNTCRVSLYPIKFSQRGNPHGFGHERTPQKRPTIVLAIHRMQFLRDVATMS